MKLTMLPVARREMLGAARRYDGKANGLGDRFLDAIRDALLAIAELPHGHPPLKLPYRRKLLKSFPFAVIYRVEKGEVIIIAVAHFKRRPRYWRRRT